MLSEKVVVLGASQNKERYSNKALNMLKEYGHQVIPVHPKEKIIDGMDVKEKLSDVKDSINTITVYVKPELSKKLVDDMISLKPQRVIFNPGAECPEIEEDLSQKGIFVQKACTLVLLRTGQFLSHIKDNATNDDTLKS